MTKKRKALEYLKRVGKATTVGLLIIGLVGCTMKGGEVADEDKNKEITCKDTRDGESFTFNTNSITNFRQGFGADHSMDIVDSQGKSRHVTSSMEAWLKCEKDN